VGGDSIIGIDGRRVTSSAELTGIVARHRPGDTVALEVVRDGATRTVRVTLADAPG
jgi:S1-C subfamily serine protease